MSQYLDKYDHQITIAAIAIVFLCAALGMWFVVSRAVPIEEKAQHDRLCKYYSEDVAKISRREGQANPCKK